MKLSQFIHVGIAALALSGCSKEVDIPKSIQPSQLTQVQKRNKLLIEEVVYNNKNGATFSAGKLQVALKKTEQWYSLVFSVKSEEAKIHVHDNNADGVVDFIEGHNQRITNSDDEFSQISWEFEKELSEILSQINNPNHWPFILSLLQKYPQGKTFILDQNIQVILQPQSTGKTLEIVFSDVWNLYLVDNDWDGKIDHWELIWAWDLTSFQDTNKDGFLDKMNHKDAFNWNTKMRLSDNDNDLIPDTIFFPYKWEFPIDTIISEIPWIDLRRLKGINFDARALYKLTIQRLKNK